MKLSQLSNGTTFKVAGRTYQVGIVGNTIFFDAKINDWKPWNGEKINCMAGPRCGKKRGRLCHPKMGGQFQKGIDCWFPEDEEVEVDYD